ncbi:hypothetical protein Zm00014a_000582 [Zea mays]|uniref:Uncharacterized protein n=1 Tax=Zea mays TaxID=4577 RepID=A0A3L6G4V7_MAIZE|nr:hypothetical protein Zm00014a_000582 [Zea mays]
MMATMAETLRLRFLLPASAKGRRMPLIRIAAGRLRKVTVAKGKRPLQSMADQAKRGASHTHRPLFQARGAFWRLQSKLLGRLRLVAQRPSLFVSDEVDCFVCFSKSEVKALFQEWHSC